MYRLILSVTLVLLLCACNLASQDSVVTPTPAVPVVQFQFPSNNFSVAAGTDLQIQLLAEDLVGVASIQLNVDGQPHQTAAPIDSETVPVFTVDMNWLAEGIGLHSLEAIAFRLDGTPSDPVLINVNVIEPTTSP